MDGPARGGVCNRICMNVCMREGEERNGGSKACQPWGGGGELMVFAGVTRVQSQESKYDGLMYAKLSE